MTALTGVDIGHVVVARLRHTTPPSCAIFSLSQRHTYSYSIYIHVELYACTSHTVHACRRACISLRGNHVFDIQPFGHSSYFIGNLLRIHYLPPPLAVVASGAHFSRVNPLQAWVYATPCHRRIKYSITIRGDAMLTRAVSSMSTLKLRQVMSLRTSPSKRAEIRLPLISTLGALQHSPILCRILTNNQPSACLPPQT